ncbi:helix-turn-helix protein [Actinomadura pelletieri DSM 43383]|uniref:Helix-turn-helix protein n=1 Tax=Actinomadura pelletieri DSM 43383 TaxID=1120940 RepID=A0A495QSJ2_9ACTN|nr:helix-turn-helix domain-containing protein [Actinomadura pelletieri]RKS76474.1 helix-turn-helix protein [Actinomadura pelletieri DSM 43383]
MEAQTPLAGDDVFLTTEEVASRYRTVPSTVRYWRHIGTGPKGTVYGRRVLYRESDLRAWEREQENDGGAAA